MEIENLTKLLPIAAGVFIFIAVFKMGRAVRAISDQTEYNRLQGHKLKFKSAEFNGINYGLCLEFLLSENHLGFRCTLPSFNFVAKYSDMAVSRSKALIGYRVCYQVPGIGEIKVSQRLANKISQLSDGKLSYEHT